MIISNKFFRIAYYVKPTNNKAGFIKYLDLSDVGYSLLPGQNIYSITYRDTIAMNQYLKYDIQVLDVNHIGIRFLHRYDGDCFYEWEKQIVNCYGDIDSGVVCIAPCGILFEQLNFKDLISEISDKIDIESQGIWYKHGGLRAYSKYQKNLCNFSVLGQQKITGV